MLNLEVMFTNGEKKLLGNPFVLEPKIHLHDIYVYRLLNLHKQGALNPITLVFLCSFVIKFNNSQSSLMCFCVRHYMCEPLRQYVRTFRKDCVRVCWL